MYIPHFSAVFYQVNPVQTEILYKTAIEYAGLGRKETVIDAYCGIGTIGLVAAKRAKNVIGVELNPDAVRDARINAKENKITNARFYQEMQENLWKTWQKTENMQMLCLWIRHVPAVIKSLCPLLSN